MYLNGKAHLLNVPYGQNKIERASMFGKEDVLSKKFRFKDCFERELYALKNIKSEHVPKLYDYNISDLMIYREYVEGQELGLNATPYALLLGEMQLEQYKKIWPKFRDFIKLLHDEYGVLLNDIWYNNILYNKDTFYIVDYELAGLHNSLTGERNLVEYFYGHIEKTLLVNNYKQDLSESLSELYRRRNEYITYLTYIPSPYPCRQHAVYTNDIIDCSATIASGNCPYSFLSDEFTFPVGAKCWLQWPHSSTNFFILNYDMDFNLGNLGSVPQGKLFNFLVKHITDRLRQPSFVKSMDEEDIVFLHMLANWAAVTIRHGSKIVLFK